MFATTRIVWSSVAQERRDQLDADGMTVVALAERQVAAADHRAAPRASRQRRGCASCAAGLFSCSCSAWCAGDWTGGR